MLFSVVMNSRGRAKYLADALEAFRAKATAPDRIEVLIAADEDDLETRKVLRLHGSWVRGFVGPRPSNLNRSINRLCEQARGRYLMVFNDDAIIQTQNWDTKADWAFQMAQGRTGDLDGIYYGATSEDSPNKCGDKAYSEFPIITIEAYKALGELLNPAFFAWGSDSYLYRVFQAVGRVVPMPEIKISHVRHSWPEMDTTWKEMSQRCVGHPDPFTLSTALDEARLQAAIRKAL